jgi:hypothetical protein
MKRAVEPDDLESPEGAVAKVEGAGAAIDEVDDEEEADEEEGAQPPGGGELDVSALRSFSLEKKTRVICG